MTHCAQKFTLVAIAGLMYVFSQTSSAHKYYFSLTEMEWNTESQTFEVVVDLSTHDAEYALSAIYNEKIFLDSKNFESLLQHWLDKHLILLLNDTATDWQWIGIEGTHKKISIFLESQVIQPNSRVKLENTLLTQVFSKQVNTVNVKISNQKKSYTFDQNIHQLNIDLESE